MNDEKPTSRPNAWKWWLGVAGILLILGAVIEAFGFGKLVLGAAVVCTIVAARMYREARAKRSEQ